MASKDWDSVIANFPKSNNSNTNRLVNPITGERADKSVDEVFPNSSLSDPSAISNYRGGQRYPGITDVNKYLKYGVNVDRTNTHDLDRALAQSNTEQFVNMLKQVGTTVAGETLSGFGSIAEIFDSLGEELKNGDVDFTNALMRWGEDLQQFGKEKAPIYQEKPNKAFNVGDFAWWMGNLPSVASSIGMMIPGYGVGYGLTKGLSALSNVTKYAKLANGLSKQAGLVGQIGAAFTMRNAENLKESMLVANSLKDDVFNMSDTEFQKLATNPEVVDKFIAETGKTFNKYNFANYVGAKGGWKNYKVDAGNVVFDFMQIAPLFKGFKTSTRAFTNNSKIVEANLIEAGKLAAGQKLSGVHSFINNAAHIGLGIGGREVLTEGAEEIVNAIASSEGTYYGNLLMGREKESRFDERFKEYMDDPHTWEQGFWGSIGGGVFAGGTRAMNSVKNAIYDINDATSTKSRLDEIKGRSTKIAKSLSDLQVVESGFNPNITDENGKPVPLLTDEDRQEAIDAVINTVGVNIGKSASKSGNVGLVLEQLESPEFIQGMSDKTGNPQETADTINKIKNKVLEVESIYKDIAPNIYSRSNIPEYIKGVIVENALNTQLEITDHIKYKNDYANRVAKSKNSIVYASINDQFNTDEISLEDSIRKVSLNNLKNVIEPIVRRNQSSGNDKIANKYDKALEKINKELEVLKDSKTVGVNTLLDKGISPILLENSATTLGHSILEDVSKELLQEMVVNTPEYAKTLDKNFNKDADTLFNNINKTFEEDLDKAETTEAIDDMLRALDIVRRRMPPTSKLIKDLNKLEGKANKRKQAIIRELKIKERASRSEVDSSDENLDTETVEETPPTDEETSEETVEEETNEETELNKEELENPLEEEESNESEDETGEEEIGEEEEEEGEETGDESELSEEEEAKLRGTKGQGEQNENEDDDDDTNGALTNDISVFISTLWNMKIRRSMLDENNTLTLNAEQTELFKKIFNKVDIGSNLTIRYDDDYNDRKNDYKKPLAVYNSAGEKLFHLNEVSISSGVFYFDHKGVRYTTSNNWTNYVVNQLKLGKFNEELSLLVQYRIDGSEAAVSKLMELGILDIININRENEPISPTNKEAIELAIDHLAKVVTYKVDLFKELPNNNQIIAELQNWDSRITSDLYYTTQIRNHFVSDASLELKTKVTSKTPGAFIKGDYNVTLNNIVGKTPDDFNVPLLFTQINAPNQASTINNAPLISEVVDRGKIGIPYIALYTGIIEGKPIYKPVQVQYTNLGMKEIPKNVSEYNNKILDYIVKLLESDISYEDMLAALKPYLEVGYTLNKKDEYIYIGTTGKLADNFPYHFKLRKIDGVWNMYRHEGKKPMPAKSIHIDGGIIRRNVNLNNKDGILYMDDNPFTDFEGTNYSSYTEFVVKTGAVVSDYGATRDSEGNLIGNVTAFSETNRFGQDLRIIIGGNPKIPTKKKAKAVVNNNSVKEYADSIADNKYNNLFTLIDSLPIIFDSTKREEAGKKEEFALYDKDTKTLKLTNKFDTVTNKHYKVRLLAHESIHAIIGKNITTSHKKRLNSILSKLLDNVDNDEFRNKFSKEEWELLAGEKAKQNLLDVMAFNVEEVITYGLTNSVAAKAFSLIETIENNEPKSLARELLDIILEVINELFGKTLLTDIAKVLDDIITEAAQAGIEVDNPIPTDDSRSDLDNDIDNLFDASISDVFMAEIPNAIDYIKSLNKEDRQIVRDAINNQTLIFKCK